MPLIQAEPRHSTRFLIFVGIPAFILAVVISLCIHQYAHMTVKKYSCGPGHSKESHVVSIIDYSDDESDCPAAAFAGISSTLFLALLSFGLFIHHPRNVFLASMAFVNATNRLPESFTVFFQLLFKRKATYIADESIALNLMHFKDPTAFVVIMCFYTLTILFLSIIVVHDVRIIPRKWLVALLLFMALIPLENLLWKAIAPLFSST